MYSPNQPQPTCVINEPIRGSERPGTFPTIYDPANILGGAEYVVCGHTAVFTGKIGEPLCAKHAENYPKFSDFQPRPL